jgi:hypothetical protein
VAGFRFGPGDRRFSAIGARFSGFVRLLSISNQFRLETAIIPIRINLQWLLPEWQIRPLGQENGSNLAHNLIPCAPTAILPDFFGCGLRLRG